MLQSPTGYYSLRNETKRNETNQNETKQNETNLNETNQNQTKQNQTKRWHERHAALTYAPINVKYRFHFVSFRLAKYHFAK